MEVKVLKTNIIGPEEELILSNFVKTNLEFDNTEHGINHALRVVKNAKKIISKHNDANYDLIIASCYVHDVADHKMFTDLVAQYEKITLVLENIGFTQSYITKVIDIIEHISYYNGNYSELNDIDSMIVRDADRLDAIGSIGIVRTITYGACKNRPFYTDDNLREVNKKIIFNQTSESTLSHFYDKLLKLPKLMHTQEAKKEAKIRIRIIKKFLKQFYREIN